MDDAVVLEPGQCQLEVWAEQASARRLQHLGPSCAVLGLEMGLNLDRTVEGDAPAAHGAGLQLKWARELQPGLSVGALWAAGWQVDPTHFAGQTLLLPLTWAPRDDLALHLNAGREFRPNGADVGRYGAALEWQPTAQWQGLAEWWRDGFGPQRRIGLRYFANDRVSVDLSRAQALDATRGPWWTLGLNWVLDR